MTKSTDVRKAIHASETIIKALEDAGIKLQEWQKDELISIGEVGNINPHFLMICKSRHSVILSEANKEYWDKFIEHTTNNTTD